MDALVQVQCHHPMRCDDAHAVRLPCSKFRAQQQAGQAHPLLVQGDLLGEALLAEVAHCIVVSIRQEVRQLVLALGILLHHAHSLLMQFGVFTLVAETASSLNGQ